VRRHEKRGVIDNFSKDSARLNEAERLAASGTNLNIVPALGVSLSPYEDVINGSKLQFIDTKEEEISRR